MRKGAWHETQSVSSSVVGSNTASTERGSSGTPAKRCWTTRSWTTCGAPVTARAASPWRSVRVNDRLPRSEEHTSELQSLAYLVCRLLLEKKKKKHTQYTVRTNWCHNR